MNFDDTNYMDLINMNIPSVTPKVEISEIYPISEMVDKQVALLQEQNKQMNETCQSLKTIIETQKKEILSNQKELKFSRIINFIMLGLAVLSFVATIIIG